MKSTILRKITDKMAFCGKAFNKLHLILVFLEEMFITVLLMYIICSLIDFIRIRLLEPKYMKAIQNLIEKMKEKDEQ